jgi:O-antigen/teichoic acid export membrane protein
MSQQNAFGLEVSRGFVAKLALAAIGFIGSVIFARYLGPVAYGAFHVVVAAANILDNPITGFGAACKKRISETGFENDEVLGAGILVAVLGSSLIAAMTVLVGPLVGFSDISNVYVYTGIVVIGLSTFKIIQPMIDGIGEFGTSVILDALRSFLTIPLQLTLVFLGWGVAGMVYGLTIGSLLTVPVSLYVLRTWPTTPTRETLGSLWSFAKFSIPNQFVGAAYSRIDILLLGAILGSGASGQYRIAYQLVLPGAFIAMVMHSGLFAEVSSRVSKGESATQKVTNNISFASIFAIPMFFGALAMPEDIVVTIFGAEYRPAATLLVGLSVFQILSTQTGQISAIISGYDRPDLNLRITIATLVVNLIFGVALVYEMGIVGVVIATVIAETVKYVLLTLYTRQFVSYSIIPKPVRYQFFAGGAMFLAVEFLHRWWGVRSAIDLFALVGIGAIIYGLLLMALSEIFLVTARGILSDAAERYC